jgi:hypothetical protein
MTIIRQVKLKQRQPVGRESGTSRLHVIVTMLESRATPPLSLLTKENNEFPRAHTNAK